MTTLSPSVIHVASLGKHYRRGLQADPGLRHAQQPSPPIAASLVAVLLLLGGLLLFELLEGAIADRV